MYRADQILLLIAMKKINCEHKCLGALFLHLITSSVYPKAFLLYSGQHAFILHIDFYQGLIWITTKKCNIFADSNNTKMALLKQIGIYAQHHLIIVVAPYIVFQLPIQRIVRSKYFNKGHGFLMTQMCSQISLQPCRLSSEIISLGRGIHVTKNRASIRGSSRSFVMLTRNFNTWFCRYCTG